MFKSATFVLLASAASSVLAHSNLFFPEPRADVSYAFQDQNQNACENENTNIPEANTFARGQTIEPKWWWNNHRGGFVKFAMVKGVTGFVNNRAFLRNENIIQGQCYTGACDQSGFDPGNTKQCVGKTLEFPDWLEDGDYILQWSQIGGFDSEAIATKALPLYHTCANVRIRGGVQLQSRPQDWVAPFDGDARQDNIRGQQGPAGVCAFKRFTAESENPSPNDVNVDAFVNNMDFKVPDGWAATGTTLEARKKVLEQQRNNQKRFPRLGRVARLQPEVQALSK